VILLNSKGKDKKGGDMSRTSNFIFHCPKCNKIASHATPMFIRYSMRRLELIIFLCGDCRLIHVDKQTIVG